MSRSSTLSAVAVLLMSAACTKPTPSTDSTTAPAAVAAPAVDAKAAEDAIRARDAAWLAASNKKDVAGVMAVYADDAVAFYGGKLHTGRDAIQKNFEADVVHGPKDLVQSWTMTSFGLSESGDVAYEIGTYDDAVNAGKQHDRGSYLTVWRKVGGEWKVVRDMTAPNAAAAKPAA